MAANEHSTETEAGERGFGTFFRNYTKTWIHTVATVGLTAFGTLTFVHRWFAALAFASYLLPPIVLYIRWRRQAGDLDVFSGHSSPSQTEPKTEGEQTEPEAATAQAAKDSSTSTTPDGRQPPADQFDDDRSDEPEQTPVEVRDGAVAAETEAGSTAMSDSDAATADSRTVTADKRVESTDDDRPDETEQWVLPSVPTAATLHDVVVTDTGRGYAVGDDGVVLAEADEWTTVLEDGPGAAGNDLVGVDATDDGDAVWVAGDSGTVGRLETDTGRHTDHTAPRDITNNWLGLAVGGSAGEETVLLVNGSGNVVRGQYRDGDVTWNEPVTPGSGSSLSGVALADPTTGYCCDTNDGVFETADGGQSFERIGIEGADGTLTDVAVRAVMDADDENPDAGSQSSVLLSADDGVVHRYDGTNWTPERVSSTTLTGIAREGNRTVACDDDGSLFERASTASWSTVDADGTLESAEIGALHAVAIGSGRCLAVGTGGMIVQQDAYDNPKISNG
ncbi:uncharacterized protein Nmag_1351 [Natrialba magadii ATCC 43099]|uniref:Uncharacterized protein n=1 Tax=Natrialba magadii (strain ATCC 43099 / DSM 3394 / CCM 3739 / CIP 104546 / IAM 13178 / JCM 8861 / NBRC 102185 / NCIMB 2190 / MS3) TaxID=547559 RepID=D3SSY4_NATMM|nr:hypothetical protein [Natrialba magadii]ADD04930.1 uncharacterized protein Nmag_1351 [Natrialba magadii ATCC 43099]ELY23979.1 hypothetical protein C500_19275 [Natrialba magadii ATCC 43099]